MRIARQGFGLPAFVGALIFATVSGAVAHEAHVQGLVLGLMPVQGRAIVRLDVPGEGSLTSTVRLLPPNLARVLAVGDRFSASADADAKPPALSHVHVLGKRPITGSEAVQLADSAPVLRDVKHLVVGDLVPDTRFIDQSGKPFAFRKLRGRSVVMAFVYTRCDDARECPLVSAKFLAMQKKLRGEPVHLVEVTLDPSYDRPPVLERYGRQFDFDPKGWTLATGDPQKVLDFAAQFEVTTFPDPRVGLIHSERTVLIDPNGVIRNMIDEGSWLPGEIIAELRAERGLASDPLERFNLWLSSAAVAVCGNSVASFSGFSDLLIVLAIFGAVAYLFWRIARGLSRGAT
ncbi:MAG: SCO family protein [Vulcanimicrobiaceae bacterium]